MSNRLLAKIGFAGVLVFLPFGIAGEQISLGIGILGLLLHQAARRVIGRFLRVPGNRMLILGSAAWVLVSVAAVLLSERPSDGVRELRKLLLLPALLLPAGAIESRRDLRLSTGLLLLAFTGASIVGLVEQMQGGGDHPTRLDGPIGFYMTTAGVFLLLSLVALALVVERSSRLPALALLAGGSALLLTYTRGAWLAFAVGAFLLLFRRRRRLALPALALFLLLLAAVPTLRERARSSWDAAFEPDRERAYVWEAGLRAFQDHPWRGAGLQDLAPLIRAYRSPEARAPLTHFHSLYVQTAVAMGVPGLLALALLFGGFAVASLGAARRSAPGLERALAEGAIAGLAAFLAHGFFEWNLGDSEVALTLYTLLGIGFAACLVSDEASRPPTA
jgi:O-antigen ligase